MCGLQLVKFTHIPQVYFTETSAVMQLTRHKLSSWMKHLLQGEN